jgi:hypothetical protein
VGEQEDTPGGLTDARAAVGEILEITKSAVDGMSSFKWEPHRPLMHVVYRASLRRQYEAIDAALTLIERGHGAFAVPLLRPALEEQLWLQYLATLSEEDAEAVVVALMQAETLKALKAQDDYAGREVTTQLGLLEYFTAYNSNSADVADRLKRLAVKLNWGSKQRREGIAPSMFFIASAVGKADLYPFLYSATSRFVHFSPSELLRRAWYDEAETVNVSSESFGKFWSAFAIVYATRSYVEVLITSLNFVKDADELLGSLEADRMTEACARLASFGSMPIITAAELAYPQRGG